MTEPVKPRRRYDSSRRREQAYATRAAVIDAARELFIEHGYVATTILSIADHAGVAPETVYAVFGTKHALLSSVVDVSIVGDDEPLPLLERLWVQEMRDEADVRRRLLILTKNGSEILARVSPIYEVLKSAAAAEPQVASLWERQKSQRFAGQRELVRIVGASKAFREGLTVRQAADIVFTIGSPETYQLLTADRGWSAARFERWYADTLVRLLLP